VSNVTVNWYKLHVRILYMPISTGLLAIAGIGANETRKLLKKLQPIGLLLDTMSIS
jgi:hypothetical protein